MRSRTCRIGLFVAAYIACLVIANVHAAEQDTPKWPLRVKTVEIVPGVDKAYLEDQSGMPFLWNADTCWFLTAAISEKEVLHYLDDRRAKGVTVIQCMLTPWPKPEELKQSVDSWRGEKPFVDQEFDRPNVTYWEHVDFVVEAAKERGLALCMALSWNGGCGHAFGNSPMWFLGDGWKKALDSPGSKALEAFHKVYGDRPWWNLVPEQPKDEFFLGDPLMIAGAETFILSGQEPYDNVRSLDEKRGAKFVTAARTPDGPTRPTRFAFASAARTAPALSSTPRTRSPSRWISPAPLVRFAR